MAGSYEPLVSVIITTYNRAYMLSQAIESILNQTFEDYEIIVVDDASTDTTREVLNEKYHEKIIYIGKEKNEGLSAARNTGIKASSGKYVAFLDDDDEWLAAKLELQIDLLQKKSFLGLVYCGYYEVKKDGEVIREIKPTKRGNIYDELLCCNCLGAPSGVIVKKEVFDKLGYFDENLSSCEDWDMWIRISRFYEMDYVDQPLVKYKIHDDNMSGNVKKMENATFIVFNKYWSEIDRGKEYQERKNKLYSDYCIAYAWRYYKMGDRHDFERSLLQALEYYPSNKIYIRGDNLREKEKAVITIFDAYWNKPEHYKESDSRKTAYTRQYIQLAWEYYQHNEMHNFRRCIAGAFKCSFPRVPLRLSVPFIKSFLGKTISDRMHSVRKRIVKSRDI